MMMRRRLACCTRDRDASFDLDEHEIVMTYNGLETCILNNQSYENESRTSREDGFPTDSLDEDYSSCSSSKDAFGSFSSKRLSLKREDNDREEMDDWDITGCSQNFYVKEKPIYTVKSFDVETMKEKFAKLLLGEDVTGGNNGISTALALSNSILNLAASVFGELWKLEPLPEERKIRWRREMDWLVSPTNYMVELVPAKQSGADGCTLEVAFPLILRLLAIGLYILSTPIDVGSPFVSFLITWEQIMTPKARADIHMNVPALQKLDSILIEALDTMVNNEFWYTEGGSRDEGRSKSERPSKRWWLPYPQVPRSGLSESEKKKLIYQGRIVHQVLKAAKSINENVLLEMPVPTIIGDALSKSGRANLGDELYKVITSELSSPEEMLKSLNLKSKHHTLDCINRLEAAAFVWKDKTLARASYKSPVRTSWSFKKDPMSEFDKTEALVNRAEILIQHLKHSYPNLPQTFLNATKVQYGKDVGHAVLEAYSRVLVNLAFSILSRIQDILQEDAMNDPNSPAVPCCFPGIKCSDFLDSPWVITHRVRRSLVDQMNNGDRRFSSPFTITTSDSETSLSSEPKTTTSVATTPSRSRDWCIGKEACVGVSPTGFP
ncbi:hypothetical protein SAY86_019482 [Trapa natans]|uniref:PRONE domain-containing protein n=1 Tax=Trapa natans TaxID=22666 RepID=A0AAN7R6W0_TRANT|nr:hypothetical protein SAY86_019482 [Trapa natans]